MSQFVLVTELIK